MIASATTIPQAAQPAGASTAAANRHSEDVSQTAASSSATLRQEHNAAILSVSLQVSIKAGNDSLSLLYRSVTENLSDVFTPGQGVDVIGRAAMEQDNSSEATAQRILDFATGFFDAYAARHPDQDAETLATNFIAEVRGGFEKGFNEARDILQGLGVLGGSEIEQGILNTYDLVMKGFDDFLALKLKPAAEEAGATPTTTDDPSQLPD